MKTDNGSVYSDFDIAVDSSARQPSGAGLQVRPRASIACSSTAACTETINGGGPEMQFTTFNGNIYLRKAK